MHVGWHREQSHMIYWLLHRSYDYLDDHSLGFLHVFEYTTLSATRQIS